MGDSRFVSYSESEKEIVRQGIGAVRSVLTGNDEDAKRSDSNIFAIYKNQLIVVVLKLGEDGISDRLQNAVDGAPRQVCDTCSAGVIA